MSQRGTGLVRKNAPVFTNHVVVRDTWKEKDSTEHLRTDGGDSKVLNYSFWKPGADCACDLVVKLGQSPVVKGDVLAESGGDTRSFVVIEVENSAFGGSPLRQSVQLAYHEDFTPTLVDED